MRYLIAGGGTGGHIIPALNIAEELTRRDPEAEFLFIGTERGLEAKIIPSRGYQIEMISALPWSGTSSLKNLWRSTREVAGIIGRFSPHCGIGTGGYVSAPLATACAIRRIPLFWQEQNTYPGMATRLASLFARRVFLGFEEARQYLWRKGRALYTGNPVNVRVPDTSPDAARKQLGLSPDKFTIFLTGGSQGAAALNEVMLGMLRQFGLPENSQLVWQCGDREFEVLRDAVAQLDLPIALFGFLDDMPLAYRVADLVISRAGALTLAEIAVFGVPAILVPYPFAAADHQRKNAKAFVARGAAVMLDQDDLTPALLYATVKELMDNPRRLAEMRNKMLSLAKPDAVEVIARTIIEDLERR